MSNPIYQQTCDIIQDHCGQNDNLRFQFIGNLLRKNGIKMEVINIEHMDDDLLNKWKHLVSTKTDMEVTLIIDMNMSKIKLTLKSHKGKKTLSKTRIYLLTLCCIYIRLCYINPSRYVFKRPIDSKFDFLTTWW